MSAVEDDDKEVTPRWIPRVIQGGKGSGGGEVTDVWLNNLKPGHTFATRTEFSIDFECYTVVFKIEGMMLLDWHLPNGKFWDRRVNPEQFCRHYKEYIILGYQPPTQGDENEQQRDRSD